MLRRLVVIWLLIAMPLQGLAARLMPFCLHAQEQGMASPDHCQTMGEHNPDKHANSELPDPASLTHCENCVSCQLAGAPAMAGATLALRFDFTHPRPASPALFYEGLAGDQPQHPPRTPLL